MDNKKYDDLDKLFQSRLKGENVVKEDWNKPPKSVFDSAMSSLDAKRKKGRRRFFLWFFAIALASAIGLISFNTLDRINQLETTIATLKKEKQENLTQETKQSTIQQKAVSEKEDEKTSIKESIESTPKSSLKPPKAFVEKTEINETSTASQFVSIQKEKMEEGEAILPLVKIEAADQAVKKVDELAFLDSRSYPVLSNWSVPQNEPMVQYTDKWEKLDNSLAFSLYVLGGLNAATIKMTNTEGADFSLTGYERYYSDFFTGIGLEHNINSQWALDLQLSYNQMQVQSMFEDEIVYDKSLEIIDNQGNVHYDSDYNVFSVMGRESGSLSLDLAQNQIEDKEQLMNKTTIDNSFRTVGLSLGALYTAFRGERFSLSFGVGTQFNYLIELEEQMETQIEFNNALLFRQSAQIDPMEKANRNYWSLFGNIRLDYALAENSGLKLDLGTSHSISSIRKTSGPEDSKTFINNLRAAVMAYYKF